MDAKTGSGVQTGIYTADAGQQTYERLAGLARWLIEGGFTAIVDAAFLKHNERERFRLLAGQLGVSFVLLDFSTDDETLRMRIRERQSFAMDPSEAGIDVLEAQLRSQEPLDSNEREHAFEVETSREPSVADLAARIAAKTRPVRDVQD
jgi:hypothetical protein